jgi:hypothetical protein
MQEYTLWILHLADLRSYASDLTQTQSTNGCGVILDTKTIQLLRPS